MTRALFTLLLLAVPVLSAGQSDVRIVKPEIRVGDSWTYRSTNLLAPGEAVHETRVSFVADNVILTVSTRKSDGKEFDASWTSEWNAVTSYSGFGYRPHSGFFRFPLHVGEKYEHKYEILSPRTSNVVNRSTATLTVIGWETVEVPAGKFRTIKMQSEGITRSQDGLNNNPQLGTVWYAPEVRRWVKLLVIIPKGQLSEELLSFKLNED